MRIQGLKSSRHHYALESTMVAATLVMAAVLVVMLIMMLAIVLAAGLHALKARSRERQAIRA